MDAATAFTGGKIYLFGSILTSKPQVSDVDILVVYESVNGLAELKEHFSSLGLMAPIDVIYMTTNEEIYLDFIRKQNATLIAPRIEKC
ncbi:nucleotidyltransferase domain-containing protein [Undibacterium sp. TC4M20W]|uniref:nucleotidyltransferase domain-containing protein n=1 Tax=unclassified Undibacterium TaxID=2630295 RepID=UPI003BEFB3FC